MRKPFPISEMKKRRGVILILTLWITLILSYMALSVAYELRLNMKLAHQNQKRLHALGLARAGLAKAVVDLRNDRLLAIAAPTNMLTDSYKDIWALPDDKTEIELGEGAYTIRIFDEQGKFNLTTMSRRNIGVLGSILANVLDMDRGDANILANLIFDWQDPDLVLASGSGRGEVEFYTDWVRDEFRDEVDENWEFQPKNDLLLNLDELMAIPGITRNLIYGSREDREERLEDDPQDLSTNSQILADHITVQGTRQVNINTASEYVIEALITEALTDKNSAEGIAKKILDYRHDLAKRKGAEGTIMNVNQLQSVGLGPNEIAQINILAPLIVSSSRFSITSTGVYEGVRKTIEVMVSVNVESYPLVEDDPLSEGRRDGRAAGRLSRFSNMRVDPVVHVLEIKEF